MKVPALMLAATLGVTACGGSALDTDPGDLTVHYGDTMHSTPAPTAPGAGRRALYYKFAEPKTFRWVPPACHYNDALFRAAPDGRVASRATTWQYSGSEQAREVGGVEELDR